MNLLYLLYFWDCSIGTVFGQLPILEINGEPFAQTLPICHYLAKQLNLIGKNDIDALKIDGVANALHDLRKSKLYKRTCSKNFLCFFYIEII